MNVSTFSITLLSVIWWSKLKDRRFKLDHTSKRGGYGRFLEAKIVSYNHVFVSHSRRDWRTKEAVEEGLRPLGLRSYFFERKIVPVRSTAEINDMIEKSRGVFVFFTPRSLRDKVTRDWIMLEIGMAIAHRRKTYFWKSSRVTRDELPVFYQQISEARNYSTMTIEGRNKLTQGITIAGKQLASQN
jgi:hypothetical protein